VILHCKDLFIYSPFWRLRYTKISLAALAPKIVAAIQRPRLFPADEFSFPYRYYLRPFK
jgi:hypothetical protein